MIKDGAQDISDPNKPILPAGGEFNLSEAQATLTQQAAGTAAIPPAAQHENLEVQYARAQAENANLEGSGSEKYGTQDWTQKGRDKTGYPVDKGSVDDVTSQPAETRNEIAVDNLKQGINTLRQHGAHNVPGSLIYASLQYLEAAYVELTDVKNGK